MLLGLTPRNVFDVEVAAIDIDPDSDAEARVRVDRAKTVAAEIADGIERAAVEFGSIEDNGLSGVFRRLLVVAVIAIDVAESRTSRSELRNRGRDHLLASHRAVEEEWVGSTYELSDCLGRLLGFRPEDSPEEAAGSWVWLNLASATPPNARHLRWVLSTRRMDQSLGTYLAAAREADGGGELSEDEARAVAARYLAQNPVGGTTGKILDVVIGGQELGRPPVVYGFHDDFWKRQWIIYLEQPGVGLRASLIIAVDRYTGEVGYVGSANDEG